MRVIDIAWRYISVAIMAVKIYRFMMKRGSDVEGSASQAATLLHGLSPSGDDRSPTGGGLAQASPPARPRPDEREPAPRGGSTVGHEDRGDAV